MLDGLRILDFTIAMAGPLATQRLAELGAEVIKVEVPGTGDLTRSFAVGGATIDGAGAAFFALNHNKRSVTLDLKSPASRPVLDRLVAASDVVVRNFRPGVAERLGLGHDTLTAIRRDLVSCSITGYGTTGPMAGAPGQDLLVQAFSGLTWNAGREGDGPHPSPVFLIDTTASHLATSAILAALWRRARTGEGLHVEVSLLGAALEMQSQELAAYSINGATNARTGAGYANVWLDPPYGAYEAKSGWVAFAQNSLSAMAEVLASEDLARLARLQPESGGPANSPGWRRWREEVHALLARLVAGWDRDTLIAAMADRGVWCGPVNDYAALLAHPQAEGFLARERSREGAEIVVPRPAIRAAGADPAPFRAAPALGEDTVDVLQGLGVTAAEIEGWRRGGAFG
jgi:crotonobetainyl-CoA:carnitine CoA-transferase CaiB-like acyl-CoA transferase